MAADEKWYFTKEQLANTPSRRCGVDADKELSYRQQAANFIQNMGQRLYVSQLCINTAIVYMHRFYMFHSLTHFPRNGIATAALFLAAKVEEQPRKLEHVIKMGHMCLSREAQSLDVKSDTYLDLAQNLVFNENALLVTLGFDVAIDHPHTHVVRCCHLVKASKDLAQTSYFMASNSLHLTTMCLQYKPTVVACFCIHLACKWSSMEIPESNEGKPWFWYVDKSVTSEMLSQLTGEFLHIFDKYPSRLKRKVRSISATYTPHLPNSSAVAPSLFDAEPRRVQSQTTATVNVNASVNANASANAIANTNSSVESVSASSQSNRQTDVDNNKKSTTMPGRIAVDYREYREKKERLERERAAANSSATPAADTNKHHSHHSKQSSSTSVQPNKHSSSSSNNLNKSMHHNHHHRQDIKSQIIPQRHSAGSNQQSRDPSRDRQRPPHNHLTDGTNNLDAPTVHPPEKLTNNVHKSSHNNKPYARYSDTQSRSSRKPDILEQRSEEVRKLIEKPLPPPKPRAEILKEEYAAKMLKHSHYPSKYDSTTEKPVSNSTQPVLSHDNAKTLNVGQTAFTVAKSPNAPVPASQISQKSLSSASSQIMPVKNGSTMTSSTSSFSLVSSFDDVMPQKKAENPPPTPVNKHRSLFSPEKTPTNSRELSHPQKSVKKAKTSPVVKDLNASLVNALHVQGGSEASQQTAAKQRAPNNTNTVTTSSHKHRNSDIGYDQQAYRQQLVEDSKRFSMPTIGLHDPTGLVHNSIPPLIQPIRDSPKTTATPLVEVKTHQPQQHHSLSNGLESSLIKQEYSTIDSNFLSVKPELPDQLLSNEMPSDLMFLKQEQQKLGDFLNFHDPVFEPAEEPVRLKQESTMSISPLKSAQAISALLQEPLAPIPSLLQQPLSVEQQHHGAREDSKPQQAHTNTLPMDNFVPSTVDISDLTGPIQCTVDVPARPTTPVAELHSTPILAPINVAPVNSVNATNTVSASEEKKSEHRSKSEKKKEKKKHKHKEKKEEKKDKHKHKHKDKVKEKHHRDKSDKEKKTEDEGTSVGGNASVIGAAPIKITIPKDKLNLSTDSIGTSSATAPGSGLKIKIPKERLKVSDVAPPPALTQPQEPLKLKISKDQLARSNSNVHVFSQQESNNSSASGSKKRERSEPSEGIPPSKKQQQPPQPQQQQQSQLVQQQLQQQQRSNERQNGRHSFANSDKVRGVGRGVGPRPNSHKFQHILNQPMRDAGYRGYHQPKRLPHHSRPLPPPPPHRTYFTNYPAAVQPPAYSYVAPIYDHSLYFQYQQQDFGAMYQAAGGMMMTADGQIDTSIPPPSMQPMFSQSLQDASKLDIDALISQPPPPPLPAGPPPSSSPPPPPPPE